MISIGAVIGGPECSFMDERLTSLMKFCKEKRLSSHTSDAIVNVVFHMPGSISRPDYVGLRTGRYSKKDNILMIQASVEEEFIANKNDKTVLQYIFEVTDEAIGIAKSYLDKKGVNYDLESDRAMLDEWLDSVTQ